MSQHPSAHVDGKGDHPALVMGGSGRVTTYRELEDASNRMAQLLRHRGLAPGDHIAVLLRNRHEWFDAVWGALRTGLYVTPVNWHLTPAEAGYIVADCGARALVADASLAETVAAMEADLGGVDIDMHQRFALEQLGGVAQSTVCQARARHDHQIGILHGPVGRHAAVVAQHTHI